MGDDNDDDDDDDDPFQKAQTLLNPFSKMQCAIAAIHDAAQEFLVLLVPSTCYPPTGDRGQLSSPSAPRCMLGPRPKSSKHLCKMGEI